MSVTTVESRPHSKSFFARKKLASISAADFPTVSNSLTRALSLVNRSNSSLAELSSVVRRDGSISMALLKVANSPVYMRGSMVDCVDRAVLVLGINGCRKVLNNLLFRGAFSNISVELRQKCEVLWQHSLLTASLATSINDLLNYGFTGEEFTAALLHDLGRILIAVMAPELFDIVEPLRFEEGPELIQRERDILGVDHCSLGGQFVEQSGLPMSIRHTVQFHHQPNFAVEHQALVALVNLADDIANHIGREAQLEAYEPTHCIGWKILFGSISDPPQQQLIKALPDFVRKAVIEAEPYV